MARSRFLASSLVALALVSASPATAQEFDAIVSSENRKPSTVLDEMDDPAERQAFQALYQKTDAAEKLKRAEAFLTAYPRSWVLAEANEIAAKAAIELGDYDRALRYASDSLKLFPENPLLLVAVSNVEAQRGLFRQAERSADDALDDVARFARPASIAEQAWPEVEQELRASCYFALGRAGVSEALASGPVVARDDRLRKAITSLSRAAALNPRDPEIPYLAGLAYLSLGERAGAAAEFAAAYRLGGPLAPQALGQLKSLFEASGLASTSTFEAYIRNLAAPPAMGTPSAKSSVPTQRTSEYAGSTACRQCHPDVYEHWSHTGMANMFRPYRPENVIGDFTRNNQFYRDDDVRWADGRLQAVPGKERALFARMVVDHGRHYFEIKQSEGWRRYPVDYTIGSKWEQAYATRLANGEIHVFPIQYNSLQKRWVNFWKIIDSPGSPRADLDEWEKLDTWTSYQANCAVCHTSQLRNVKGGGFEANNLEFREPGIDCEMCHGPSKRHVESFLKGRSYAKRPLDPPVDFSKIRAQAYLAICSQCHMQSAIRAPGRDGELNYAMEGDFFQRYLMRPYEEFSRKGFYKDGRFRETTFIVESLMRSECFRQGHATCGSCHDPHGRGAASNPTSLKFREHPDQMCLQCHSQFSGGAAMVRHTHHPADSQGSRCVSCHMPRIMDALLFEARTHRIDDVPDAGMTERFGQEESPNACLLCHIEKSAGWVREQLVAWKQPGTRAEPSHGR